MDDFKVNLDEFYEGKLRSSEVVCIGRTPKILHSLGAKDYPIIMTQKNLKKTIQKPKGKNETGHFIKGEIIKKLPELLSNPVIVIRNEKMNAFVIVTNQRDYKNDIIIIAIHLEKEFNQRRVNEIKSVYGRENELEYFIRQFSCNNILYVDKNRAIDLLRSRGLQLPKASTNLSSKNKLSHKNKNVNRKNGNRTIDSLHSTGLQLPRASANQNSKNTVTTKHNDVKMKCSNRKKDKIRIIHKGRQDYER